MSATLQPFINRKQELDRLSQLIAAARAGRGGVVVIRGDRGMGKSALVRKVLADGARFGIAASAQVSASEPGEPFAALAQRLLAALGRPPPEPRKGPTRMTHVFGEVASEYQTLVLAIDDAEHLDAPSVDALLHLAPDAFGRAYVLLLVVAQDPPWLERLLQTLGTTELELEPFDRKAIAEYMQAVGLDLSDEFLEAFTRETAGLPGLFSSMAEAFSASPADAVAPTPRRVRSSYLADAVPPDVPVRDEMGAEGEAEALARLILDRDVHPPLSIGLFGDWGSGKSFFMRLIKQHVEDIAGRSKRVGRERTAYCSAVRQIDFNAWHYADDNLWASLMTRILQGVGSPKQLSELSQELVETGSVPPGGVISYAAKRHAEVSASLHEAEERRDQAQRRLDALDEASSAKPVSALLEDSATLTADPAVQDAEARIRERFGPSAAQGAGEAEQAAGEFRRLAAEAKIFWSLVRGGSGARRLAAVGGGLLLLAFVGGLVALAILEPGLLTTITVGVAGLTAALTALTKGAKRAEAIGDEVRQAAGEGRERAEGDLRESEEQIASEQAELARIDDGTAIAEHLAGRAAEYRSRQGLIALVREELDQLAEALKSGPDANRVDRVILYVDDLDRCEAPRVVQVLEAVHLLLALQLFVVVVGVDSRWLLSSLENQYAPQLTGASGSSAQQYLEKIFQIPYAIRSIQPDGFQRLMRSMMPVDEPEEEGVAVDVDGDGAAGDGNPARETTTADDGDATATGDGAREELEPHKEADDPDLLGSSLRVTPEELSFAAGLQPLIRSPRGAKRLVNVYRLIVASASAEERAALDGGEHRHVLLLLAVLVGRRPGSASAFAAIRTDEAERTFTDLLEGLGVDNDCAQTVLRLRGDLPIPDDVAPYRRWLPAVARFSFDMAAAG